MCLKRKCELIVLHPVKLQYLPIIIRIIRNNNKQKPSSFTTNTNKQQLLPPHRESQQINVPMTGEILIREEKKGKKG